MVPNNQKKYAANTLNIKDVNILKEMRQKDTLFLFS